MPREDLLCDILHETNHTLIGVSLRYNIYIYIYIPQTVLALRGSYLCLQYFADFLKNL